MEEEKKVSVLVIGAGISGLSAASWLMKNGVEDVLVVEARERVGGRTCNETIELPQPDGSLKKVQTDVGGAYVGPTQDRLFRIAKELGIETSMVYEQGLTVLDVCGKQSRYKGTIPTLSIIPLLDLNSCLNQIIKLEKQIDPSAPWSHPNAHELDSITVEQWLNGNAVTGEAKASIRAAVQSLLCVEPSEVSALFFLFYCASGRSINRLVNITNGAQERKFIGGSQLISLRMAERLGSSKLKLGTPIKRLEHQPKKGVRAWGPNGELFQADHVIVALPPSLYSTIQFQPPLPAMKQQLGDRMPLGSIIKTITFYKKAFWREAGLSGSFVSDQGPIVFCIDDCKPDGSSPAIMGFILATHARQLSELPKEERQRLVCEQYRREFGSDEALQPLCYVEKNWAAEEFTKGCYVGIMQPGTMTQFGKVLREPVGPIHFAGTETATIWNGYMDGAIQAGERAAHEVARDLVKEGEEKFSSQLKQITAVPFRELEPPSLDVPCLPTDPPLIEQMLPSIPGLIRFFAVTGAVALSLYLYNRHSAHWD